MSTWANAVNANQAGIQTINDGVWTGSEVDQYAVLVGAASNAVTSVDPVSAGYVLTDGGPGNPPSYQPPGAIPFSDQAVSFNAAAGNIYLCTAALTVTLPTGASQGSSIQIICDANPVVIQASTLDTIQLGTQLSSAGGTFTNVNATGDAVTLTYDVTSLTWWGSASQGAWLNA